MTLINVQRLPSSVIFSWTRDGYFDDKVLSRATSQMLTFQYKGKPVPFLAAGWKDEYVKLGPADNLYEFINRSRRQVSEKMIS